MTIYSFVILFSQLGKEPVSSSMSGSYCHFLTCIEVSQETGKVVWYSQLLRNLPQFVLIHTVEGLSIVNEAEVDVFLKLPCFLHDPTNVGNLRLMSKPQIPIPVLSLRLAHNGPWGNACWTGWDLGQFRRDPQCQAKEFRLNTQRQWEPLKVSEHEEVLIYRLF